MPLPLLAVWGAGALVAGLVGKKIYDSNEEDKEREARNRRRDRERDEERRLESKRNSLKSELSNLNSAFSSKWGVSANQLSPKISNKKNELSKVKKQISELEKFRGKLKG